MSEFNVNIKPPFAKGYIENDYYTHFKKTFKGSEAIRQAKCKLAGELDREVYWPFWVSIPLLPTFRTQRQVFDGDTVVIGDPAELDAVQGKILTQVLKGLIPWRKGPFEYFGTHIDSEWRSDMKWNRFAPLLGEIKGKNVADVGCSNTYYMYRLLAYKPRLVVGFEPKPKNFFHFMLNQRFVQAKELQYELLGVEEMALFENYFDAVLFMGVIYHRRDPLGALQSVATSLKKGGLLIFETAGIPGNDPVCLIPEGRYLCAPGYWFLPTASACVSLLKRTGFTDIKVLSVDKTDFNEQRYTPWLGKRHSLEQFLDPSDPDKTVEGYPAPVRICISARKR